MPDFKTGRKVVMVSVAAMDVLNNLDPPGDPDNKPCADLKPRWHLITAYDQFEVLRVHDPCHTMPPSAPAFASAFQLSASRFVPATPRSRHTRI